MSQERVSNDEFLNRLTVLLSSTHSESHGSVYLTQKPLIPTTADSSSSSPSPPSQILVRATNGLSKPHRTAKPKSKSADSGKPKVKLATVVEVADLDAFYARYAEVCKKGMEGLRKRDKKKAKEKAKAKKKGKAATGAAGA
ncbi:hypothetical protein A1O1_06024 [Capronia coronata CBS 617.96]|uniref:Signal recognition particle subunit SRP14 n=1 Tax=Capronia coronata CBS 617.96 TaxID=1182541 RepID=W9XZJ2_9EURO|nr:uncharacterized protein A1O1_06024 [Capronia coronata CBS 617.96]EXJ85658.1 hypothetical protein A1O1_06024 [Capronia coronata CBS 617.96]